jgi:hypothetical protein
MGRKRRVDTWLWGLGALGRIILLLLITISLSLIIGQWGMWEKRAGNQCIRDLTEATFANERNEPTKHFLAECKYKAVSETRMTQIPYRCDWLVSLGYHLPLSPFWCHFANSGDFVSIKICHLREGPGKLERHRERPQNCYHLRSVSMPPSSRYFQKG